MPIFNIFLLNQNSFRTFSDKSLQVPVIIYICNVIYGYPSNFMVKSNYLTKKGRELLE